MILESIEDYPHEMNVEVINLLKWLNDILNTNFQQLQEMRDAVGYLTLMDMIYPLELFDLDFIDEPVNFGDRYKNVCIMKDYFNAIGIDFKFSLYKMAAGHIPTNYDVFVWFHRICIDKFKLAE